MVERYKNAMRKLWVGRCTVSVYKNKKDMSTMRTEQVLETLFGDEPCRLSYKTVDITAEENYAAKKVQKTTLYISSEITIPEGSKITVTQLGVTRDFEQSGTPAVYSTHQEVPLKLIREYA